MFTTKSRYPGGHQKGFSLIEVLVAGAIMSSGLAGLAALLFTSVSGTAQSAHQTAASMLADSMVAMIEISPQSRQVFLRAPPIVTSDCDQDHPCSSDQFSEANLKSWSLRVAQQLPNGRGVICMDSSPFDGSLDHPECNGGTQLVVKVFWQAGAGISPSGKRVVRFTE